MITITKRIRVLAYAKETNLPVVTKIVGYEVSDGINTVSITSRLTDELEKDLKEFLDAILSPFGLKTLNGFKYLQSESTDVLLDGGYFNPDRDGDIVVGKANDDNNTNEMNLLILIDFINTVLCDIYIAEDEVYKRITL